MEDCIISGRYETGRLEQQLGFNQLFGEENVQYDFDLYFHWYNIIHELGHSLVEFKNIKMNCVEEEVFVNCFAVEYWKNVDYVGNLKEVQELNKKVLSKMPALMTVDTDFYRFFNDIWGSEQMRSTMMYGYFQMLCVVLCQEKVQVKSGK